jgi:glycosyltransferase involved in cell wall biosynthesis
MGSPHDRAPVGNAALSVILVVPHVDAALEPVVISWLSFLRGLEREFEVLLVDSGGSAETLAPERPGRHPEVRVLRPALGRGLGAALRTGLAQASRPLVFYCADCDRYQPSDLAGALKVIDHVDLAVGQRAGRWWRPLGERGFRWIMRWVFAVRLADPACVFVLGRRSAFEHMVIQSDGRFAHGEVLAKANFLGCLMTEVPVSYKAPQPPPAEFAARFWQEFRRVYSRPDFGPGASSGSPARVDSPANASPTS